MLLGKRPRPPMRRTTSMTEIPSDLNAGGEPQESSKERQKSGSENMKERQKPVPENSKERQKPGQEVFRRYMPPDGVDWRFQATLSPRVHRRNPGDFFEVAHFLQSCTLCKRRLGPGRDIYMYRGDSAFCSHECRQQQMNLDERKEKCSLTSMRKEAAPATGNEASSNGETVAAA